MIFNEFNKSNSNDGLLKFANRYYVHILIVVIALVCVVFNDVIGYSFSALDIQLYLQDNNEIMNFSWDKLGTLLTSTYGGHYHPLTIIFYLLPYKIFGLEPTVYHTLTLLLHCVNIVVVFWFVHKLSDKLTALLAVLIFAFHPLGTESYVWIPGMASSLVTIFYIPAVLYYIKYVASQRKVKYLLISAGFTFLAINSKSIAITLPVMFLFLDVFIEKKIKWKKLMFLLPFFALSVIYGLMAIKGTYVHGSMNSLGNNFSYFDRIFLISGAINFQLGLFFWPVNLCVFHFMPDLVDGLLPVYYYWAPL
ncbi:MAG: hypothetical protein C0594_08955, partial [Marinilabiliales bacterium]